MDYSINVHVIDSHAAPSELSHEYGINLVDKVVDKYNIKVLAVGRQQYTKLKSEDFKKISDEG